MLTAVSLFAWLATAGAEAMQSRNRPTPTPMPLIDNDEVTVWDVSWATSRVVPDDDAVVIVLAPPTDLGRVVYWRQGTPTPAGLGASRTIVIGIKNFYKPPLVNPSGFPNAFPRKGAIQRLDNAKVVVWDYTWTAGVPTPVHFHDKDVVVVYLDEGSLRSTTSSGGATVGDWKLGDTRFNLRDRVHTEELVKGRERAIITELK